MMSVSAVAMGHNELKTRVQVLGFPEGSRILYSNSLAKT